MRAREVVVVGGGIIGCSAATLLAEGGAAVTLVEATALAAGASGRNSGSIQHPFDAVLGALHLRSLTLYRGLEQTDAFGLPAEPAGILLLTRDLDDATRRAAELHVEFPDLEAVALDAVSVSDQEPTLSPGWAAVHIHSGYPTRPEAATRAWGARAERAGVDIRVGSGARPVVEAGRVMGVALMEGTRLAADAVLLAAGPWSPELLPRDGWRPAITRTWGVTVQVRPPAVPSHILEEGTVHTINTASGMTAADDEIPSIFSLMPAADVATIGSTFVVSEPDPEVVAPLLLERAGAFVPGIGSAELIGFRVCGRPQSADGYPFIGPVPGIEGLTICAGHGPWGLSTGPASAELAVASMISGAPVPNQLRADREVRPN
jgi:glycine/D-amino acid oxidase-like deaminating enzyme